MKIFFLIKILIILLFFILQSCNTYNDPYHSFAFSLCSQPDSIVSKNVLKQLPDSDRNSAISMLNYNVEMDSFDKVDSRVYQIQDIIYKQNNLVEIDKSNFDIDWALVPTDQIETELFIRLNSKLNLNTLSQEELEKIKSILKKAPKNGVEWYNYIRILKILAKHYETILETEKSYTTYLYGIFLIQKSSVKEKLLGLSNDLITSLSIQLSKEEDFFDYYQTEKRLSNQFDKNAKRTFNGLMKEAYFQEVLFLKDSINEYYQALCAAELKAKSKSDSMVIMLNFTNYYALCGDQDSYIEYSKNSIEQFDRPSCTMKYFRALMSILERELPEKELESYQQKLEFSKDCPDRIQRYVEFIRFQSINDKNQNQPRKLRLRNLISESQEASKIAIGRSTVHLQDYYLSNLDDICNLYTHNEEVESEMKETVLNQFYMVRAQDLHRQTIFKNPINGNEHNRSWKRIREIFLSMNNFKDIPFFDDPVYQELFELYVLKSSDSEIPAYEQKIFNTAQINQSLQDKVILNFFRDRENYIVYRFVNDKLHIFRFNTKMIDAVLTRGYEDILKQKECEGNVEQIFRELIFDFNDRELIIISDGALVNFPLSFIFPEAKKIYQYSNIAEMLNVTETMITPNQIAVSSYSSDKTISSSKKRKFTELKYGLKESKEIAKLIRGTNDIIAGIDFTRETILNSKSRMLHLSTHAKSNTFNKFDNYIVTRGGQNKLYGFELYESNQLPEVVIFSACESGIGLHTYGAGVQTLSRAFLDNGTQTVIKTLWKVNERATAEFMIDMYKHWATGISLYDALEKTKNEFKTHDEYCAPYYWAGFVLEGNPNVYLEKEN